jgi:hypothetical protein
MTDTDVEVKNASIKITGDDVKLSIQFQGFATVERAQKFLQRLHDLADELSVQTHLKA